VICCYWCASAAIFNEYSAFHARSDKVDLREKADAVDAIAVTTLGAYYREEADALDPEWGFGVSMYYTAITFLTIGLGDYSVMWKRELAILELFTFVTSASLGICLFIRFSEVLNDNFESEKKKEKGKGSALSRRKWKGVGEKTLQVNTLVAAGKGGSEKSLQDNTLRAAVRKHVEAGEASTTARAPTASPHPTVEQLLGSLTGTAAAKVVTVASSDVQPEASWC